MTSSSFPLLTEKGVMSKSFQRLVTLVSQSGSLLLTHLRKHKGTRQRRQARPEGKDGLVVDKQDCNISDLLVLITITGVLCFWILFKYLVFSGRWLIYLISYEICKLCKEPLPEKPTINWKM